MRYCLQQIATVALIALTALGAWAVQSPANAADTGLAADTPRGFFAVEIKVGPNWDTAKAPADQVFFEEHSANLKRLREAGYIVMGARYSDIGLIIFTADSAAAVREFMEQDPAMTAGTFRYEIHPINIFYSWRDAP